LATIVGGPPFELPLLVLKLTVDWAFEAAVTAAAMLACWPPFSWVTRTDVAWELPPELVLPPVRALMTTEVDCRPPPSSPPPRLPPLLPPPLLPPLRHPRCPRCPRCRRRHCRHCRSTQSCHAAVIVAATAPIAAIALGDDDRGRRRAVAAAAAIAAVRSIAALVGAAAVVGGHCWPTVTPAFTEEVTWPVLAPGEAVLTTPISAVATAPPCAGACAVTVAARLVALWVSDAALALGLFWVMAVIAAEATPAAEPGAALATTAATELASGRSWRSRRSGWPSSRPGGPPW